MYPFQYRLDPRALISGPRINSANREPRVRGGLINMRKCSILVKSFVSIVARQSDSEWKMLIAHTENEFKTILR